MELTPKAQVAPYHIAIDARFFRKATAGIGRYTREIIHHLAALDSYNQYTVYLTPADKEEWTLDQANFQVEVVDIPHFSFAEQTTLLRDLYGSKYDLVHFLNINHPIFYFRPFITTFHDLILLFFPAGKGKKSQIRYQIFKYVLRDALHRAKKVIAVSEYSAQDATKHLGVSPLKMEVIPHGAPDPVELPFGSKARVQEYLGTRDSYFLFVSQWYPHKGLLTLLEGFEQFKKQSGLPHKLVLLGNQKVATTELRERIAASPYNADIVTPGFAPDELLPALYQGATAYVLPSEYEGFGLPALEAFQYGTPVIASDSSSIPEAVGTAGLLFPNKDGGALATELERIANDPALRHDLIEKGKQQLKKFSWERAAQQTLNLYYTTLEKQR